MVNNCLLVVAIITEYITLNNKNSPYPQETFVLIDTVDNKVNARMSNLSAEMLSQMLRQVKVSEREGERNVLCSVVRQSLSVIVCQCRYIFLFTLSFFLY